MTIMSQSHTYVGEFPGWCSCTAWLEKPSDFDRHLVMGPVEQRLFDAARQYLGQDFDWRDRQEVDQARALFEALAAQAFARAVLAASQA